MNTNRERPPPADRSGNGNLLPDQPVETTYPDPSTVRVLVVVEGTNDIQFLTRIAAILHAHDSSLPHLARMEQQGELIFFPFGGGKVSLWTDRLIPLRKPEMHVYDHELPPETAARREAAERVNRRDNCLAVVTRKRSLEHYLHPQAIRAAGNIELEFDDFDPLAAMAAKRLYLRHESETPWELLPHRTRKRLTYRAKRWLNTRAVAHMTTQLLAVSDPDGEVIGWLAAIAQLARHQG